MENKTQDTVSPIQPTPQTSVSPATNWLKILLLVILGLVIVAVSVFVGIKIGKNQMTKQQLPIEKPAISPSSTPTIVNPTINPITNWKTYESKEFGFLIKYPVNLTLRVNNGQVELNHNIPYKNSGDCDMSGGTNEYPTLDDFNLSFSVLGVSDIPEYAETIKIGKLDGKVALEGAEGCGDTFYYFNTPDNKTLVIKRANIQALSGIRGNKFEEEEILKIPGVISREENERLFKLILSSLEFVSH